MESISTKFLDKDFKPNPFSIFGREPPDSGDVIMWERIEEKLPPGTNLISKTSADDIIQGELGDCWFLASMAAIAEKPKLVRKMFNTPLVNVEGRYCFTFYKDGAHCAVEVDSFLPFTTDGRLYSARAHHNNFWVALTEKACAKMVGGYYNMAGGDCEEALRIFTGCPTKSMDNNTPDEKYWAKLLKYASPHNEKYLLTCGINSKALHPLYSKESGRLLPKHLIADHVYTVVDARQNEPLTRLLTLRNPWGGLESGRGNGVFAISFEEFRRYFNCVSICYVRDDWSCVRVYSFFQKRDTVESPTIELTLPERCEIHLGIHQKDLRAKGSAGFIDAGLHSPPSRIAFLLAACRIFSLKPIRWRHSPQTKGALLVDQNGDAVTFLEVQFQGVTQGKFKLPAGTFHILPYSSGVHFPPGRLDCLFSLTAHCAGNVPASVLPVGLEKGRVEKAFASALVRLGQSTACSLDGQLLMHQLFSRDMIAVGVEMKAPPVLGHLYHPLAMQNPISGKSIVLFDLSHSVNISPTLNSLRSTAPQCLVFPPGEGMFVAKFVRSSLLEFEFNLECRVLSGPYFEGAGHATDSYHCLDSANILAVPNLIY